MTKDGEHMSLALKPKSEESALSFYSGMKPDRITEIQDHVRLALINNPNTLPMEKGVADMNFIKNVKAAQESLHIKADGKWGSNTEKTFEAYSIDVRMPKPQEYVKITKPGEKISISVGEIKITKTPQMDMEKLGKMMKGVSDEKILEVAGKARKETSPYLITVNVHLADVEVPITLPSNVSYDAMKRPEQQKFGEMAIREAYRKEHHGQSPGVHDLENMGAITVTYVSTKKQQG